MIGSGAVPVVAIGRIFNSTCCCSPTGPLTTVRPVQLALSIVAVNTMPTLAGTGIVLPPAIGMMARREYPATLGDTGAAWPAASARARTDWPEGRPRSNSASMLQTVAVAKVSRPPGLPESVSYTHLGCGP